MFPDPRLRCLSFEHPGSAGAGPRQDLIDRVPDELWTEICDIVQETGIKNIPKKKKCKKAKWLSEEALQIAEKKEKLKAKEKRKDIFI